MALPLVAIVGAPNVGKSTLFNRLAGRRRAIVTDEPGVTRDRLYAEVRRTQRPFRIVDTGGLTPNTEQVFAEEIEHQALAALGEASVVMLVVDAAAGLTALDRDVALMLRRHADRLIVVANKVDSKRGEAQWPEVHELGLGDPVPVSAEHSRGIDELLDRIEALLDDGVPETVETAPRALSVAIVGRPNVGKSSLLNRLAGEQRVLVSHVPGTTRDSVDTLLEVEGRHYRLVDTAGIRKRGRLRGDVERFSVKRAHQNIAGCDVAVLVLDATQPLAAQDAHIAGYVLDAFKPLLVVVNKWDLVEEREQVAKQWEEQVRRRLRFAKDVSMLLISAVTGQRVARILELADDLYERGGRRVPTPELNRWLREAAGAAAGTHPSRSGPRLFYATQTGIRPPRFLIFCNDPARVHFSLRRRLENTLRDRYGYGAAPVRLEFRPRRDRERSGPPGA